MTYTVTLTNSGPGAQTDNPGNEFTDVLPATLALVSASASSGTAVATVGTNTVTWNGALAPSASVTITINATILPAAAGTTVNNQGTFIYDGDGNGTNETSGQTDDPAVVGANNPTPINVTGTPAAVIPTLDEVGFLAMLLLLGGIGVVAVRRRSAGLSP